MSRLRLIEGGGGGAGRNSPLVQFQLIGSAIEAAQKRVLAKDYEGAAVSLEYANRLLARMIKEVEGGS